jgi:mannose-1-phosphate guanylyltransferase
MNGLLLAAGLGTRFRPFTEILPKPAIPLLNVPIAYYNLHLLQSLELSSLTVNTHHLPEGVKKIFSEEAGIGIPLHFSDEAGEILGTGGAIKKARPTLQGTGTFVVANADVVNGFAVTDALTFHHENHPMATMVVIKHPEAGTKYGAVWVNDKNEVVDISRKKPAVKCEPFHFVGVHFVEESVFKYIPDGPCSITEDVYLPAIKAGEKVLAYEKTGMWFDAGSLADFLEATDSLMEVLPKLQHQPFFQSLFRRFWPDFDKRPNLWEGENCEHLLNLGTKNKILLGRNCRIHPSVRVSGFAVFGDNVTIDENVVLKNVVLGSGVKVPADTKIADTLVLKEE